MIGFYNYTVILTYLGLCSAFMGIIQTFHGNIRTAIFFLMFSGFCDMFDGIVARTRKNSTRQEKNFGIQIDSLSDVIAFGVLPACIHYQISSNSIVGAVISILFVLNAVIRLGYFNVMEEERQSETEECRKSYQGLPVTTAAVIFPLVYLSKVFVHQYVTIVFSVVMVLVACLFISNFKIKKPGLKTLLAIIPIAVLILLGVLFVA